MKSRKQRRENKYLRNNYTHRGNLDENNGFNIDEEANFRAGGGPHETYVGQYEEDFEIHDQAQADRYAQNSRQRYENKYPGRDYNGGKDRQRNQYESKDYSYRQTVYQGLANAYPDEGSFGQQQNYNQEGKPYTSNNWNNEGGFPGNRASGNGGLNNRNYGWDRGRSRDEKFRNQESNPGNKKSRSGRMGFGGRNLNKF